MTNYTREDALNDLARLASSTDLEGAHIDADDILCELLLELGYNDVVEAYIFIDKGYA